MTYRTLIYVDGDWRTPHGGEALDVENLSTQGRVGSVVLADEQDVDATVAAARAALPSWAATSPTERARVLRGVQAALAERQDEVARTISTEMGCPIRISTEIQAALPLTVLGGYADLAEAHPFTEQVGNSKVVHQPVGVVAAITPWNYSPQQIVCKLAPALAAGCTVVVKLSEASPLVVYLLFDALHEAGVPAGVVNLVPGRGSDVGEALAAHPGVDMASFTGSHHGGTRVAAVAARTVQKVSLELGGKSANVVLDDADWKTAVKVGVANAFLNSDQACTAWTRMLVHDSLDDDDDAFAADIAAGNRVGDPLDPATRLGPVVSAAQRERVLGFVEIGMAEGARLVTGGVDRPAGLERPQYVVPAVPAVLADVDADATVAQEEIFGAVLSVLRFRDDEDAPALANNSRYRLAGAVRSGDQDRAFAFAFAEQVQTGSIDVNGGACNPMAPFGGVKQSGPGREMGRAGLEEFLQTTSIQL